MAIQAVQRALKILSLFSLARPNLSIAEISRLMDLPKPTVHGLVQTLLQEGYLSQDEQTRQYAVGLRVVEMGSVFAGSLKINQVGGDLAQRLAASCGRHSRIAMWDSDSMLVTFNAFPSLESMSFQQIGPRVPAYCSSIGKAVLSTLDDIELAEYLDRTELIQFTPGTITDKQLLIDCLQGVVENGYALENSEFLLGMSCIGVPVYDSSHKAMGAISLSGTSDILGTERLSEIVPRLIQTGTEISRRMGYYPEATPPMKRVVG